VSPEAEVEVVVEEVEAVEEAEVVVARFRSRST
jgi:hypothetical protein